MQPYAKTHCFSMIQPGVSRTRLVTVIFSSPAIRPPGTALMGGTFGALIPTSSDRPISQLSEASMLSKSCLMRALHSSWKDGRKQTPPQIASAVAGHAKDFFLDSFLQRNRAEGKLFDVFHRAHAPYKTPVAVGLLNLLRTVALVFLS